jgi:peptide/nickel transport system ATP-binding protein
VLLEVRNLSVEFPAGRKTPTSAPPRAEPAPPTPPPSLLALKESVPVEAEAPTPPPVGLPFLPAVRDVSFGIAQGEVLGLVGESGSGKSVTSLAVMGLLAPQAKVTGEILFQNGTGAPQNLLQLPVEEMRRVRGARIAMIFQEPMTALNPVMRVGEQVAEAVRAHHPGATKREARERAVTALGEVSIPDPEQRARDFPHQLSGGQRQRVMIAMAIVNRPALLIADEPTTALDVTIQAQVLELLAELRAKFQLTMLFISHDLAVVSTVADRVAVMYGGSLVELGRKSQIFSAPAHPYTRGLLQAVPTLRTDRNQPLRTIEGTVPPLHAMPPGCPFEPRCELREAACASELPRLVEISSGHWARCPVANRQTT